MSRLTDKLAQVGAIVPRQTALIEARADAMIAKESELEKRTDQAFSPHEAILNETAKGLDDLEKQLALLSNSPLSGSETITDQKKNNG